MKKLKNNNSWVLLAFNPGRYRNWIPFSLIIDGNKLARIASLAPSPSHSLSLVRSSRLSMSLSFLFSGCQSTAFNADADAADAGLFECANINRDCISLTLVKQNYASLKEKRRGEESYIKKKLDAWLPACLALPKTSSFVHSLIGVFVVE